jgi:hypothetical protein
MIGARIVAAADQWEGPRAKRGGRLSFPYGVRNQSTEPVVLTGGTIGAGDGPSLCHSRHAFRSGHQGSRLAALEGAARDNSERERCHTFGIRHVGDDHEVIYSPKQYHPPISFPPAASHTVRATVSTRFCGFLSWAAQDSGVYVPCNI